MNAQAHRNSFAGIPTDRSRRPEAVSVDFVVTISTKREEIFAYVVTHQAPRANERMQI
jgi:hypothetical protein